MDDLISFLCIAVVTFQMDFSIWKNKCIYFNYYLLCINITDGSYITRYTRLYSLLLAQHLISSHWLSKTHWSRWWKETASILWKEDGIRSASWQSWRWMEGMIISNTKRHYLKAWVFRMLFFVLHFWEIIFLGVCSKNCWRQWQTGISHETGNSYQRPCEIASQQRTFLFPPQTHWRAS